MASGIERLIIVTIVTCFLMGLGSTLKLETTPEPFNVFTHKQINITCIGDGPSFWARDVVLMEIGRQEEKPIAIVNAKTKRTDMGPGSGPNMQAVGHIDKEATYSFLTVIINKPRIEDAGTYICRMFYVDEEFQIEEETALVNVTVDNQDIVAMVTYLIERVSALENSNKECEGVCNAGNQSDVLNDVISRQNQTIQVQGHQIESQGQHISLVNDVVANLKDTIDSQDHQIDVMNDVIANLSDTIKGYDHQIKSQGHHVTVLEIAITEVTHNMTTKDHDNTAIVSDLQNTVTVLNETVSQLGKYVTQQMENDTTQCAFSIGYNKDSKLKRRQILKFTDTITNIGHHYNTDTGIFTAPRDGVYVFHLVVTSFTAEDKVVIRMYRNSDENPVAGVYAEDIDAHVDQASVSVVLSLVQGDTVYPRAWSVEGTDHLSSEFFSVFSGFILKVL